MAFIAKNIRQSGKNIFLIFIICVLTGCVGLEAPSGTDAGAEEQNVTADIQEAAAPEDGSLPAEFAAGKIISEEEPVETENAVYEIRERQTERGVSYPQIVLKGEEDILCGAEFLNDLLEKECGGDSYGGYQIFYGDENILSVCFWYDTEKGRIFEPMVIDFQCLNYQAYDESNSHLQSVQDDNACPAAPIPGNGVRISFDVLLRELERGNYELDQDAYALGQSEFLVQSIGEHLGKIQDRGLQDTYFGYMRPYKIGTRGMYLKEGRVGFFIFLPERWEELGEETYSYEWAPYDFRVEIEYDWKAELPQNQVSYEVYRVEEGDGAYGYPQVRGLGETQAQAAVNQAILDDFGKNLSYLDLDKTNRIMRDFGHEDYWRKLPEIGPPRVTWQSGRYLCIRQEPLLDETEVLRFAEEWKRYHVYDLEAGRSLGLGDILNLTPEFAKWLKEERKLEGWTEYHEGDSPGELGELLWGHLERYTQGQLLSALEDAEFWMKEGALYFRLPLLDQWDRPLYSYGGTSYPDYPVYAECRIKRADLAMWVNEEHREDFLQEESGSHGIKEASMATSAALGWGQGMPRAIRMLAGEGYHIALCEDGTVWSWGDNADGKLGVEADVLLQPERLPELENVVKIVDGGKDIFALTAGGEVYYWGWGLEDIRYEKKHADGMVLTPARLEGLEEIVDLDGKNRRLFALDKEGRLYSLGMCLDYALMSTPVDVFSGCEELGRNIDRIVAGAGNYHYFIRKDGTVCSIMESFDDIFTPYMLLFPAQGEGMPGVESYARPEEVDSLVILNKDTKVDHVVYYDLAGVSGVETASADGYTVFLGKTDGTLWYWDSDRIKYHDDERALLDPESAWERCQGRFARIDIGEILSRDGERDTPRVIAMESGLECTMFLTDDGSVFVSRYETCGVEDVACYVKGNPRPGYLPSVVTIEDMELKTIVFERLAIENIVSIASDGRENFIALDVDGVCYRFAAMDSEAVRGYR